MNSQPERPVKIAISDASVAERLEHVLSGHDGHPLLAEIEWLAAQYQRLQQRFDKITAMSDRLQEQLMAMNKMLQEQVISDPLTGLMNRAGLQERLVAECARLAREHTPFGLLMLDLDHFKEINDAFGHSVGDQVLVDVAVVLRRHMRPYDVFARWGGEEFLLLLPAVDHETLLSTAQRLLEAVRGISVRGVGDMPSVRVSIGLYLCSVEEDPADSVRKADIALYLAKNAGRDRMMVFQ